MSADDIADHIRAQLRLIRAENEKRDRDFALLRAEFKMFSTVVGSKLDVIVSMLSTHTDTLYTQINDRLLRLELQREGEPGTEP